jgi:dephospho-CoA kinase
MIIGIAGKAGAGKNTAAEYISSKLEHHHVASFAEPIKQMLRMGLQLTWDQTHGHQKEMIDPRYGVSTRSMMQTLATEWGRDMIHTDLWLIIAQQSKDNRRIFSDVRFENEAAWIRENGFIIHLSRNIGNKMNHASEKGISVDAKDFYVMNNDTKEDLYKQLDTVIKKILLKL